MTFEEWWAGLEMRLEPLPMDYAQDFEACWNAAQFALNNEMSVAANEAAKSARRKVALEELGGMAIFDEIDVQKMDAIIKQAQG